MTGKCLFLQLLLVTNFNNVEYFEIAESAELQSISYGFNILVYNILD